MNHDELLVLVTGGTNYKMADEHLLYRKVLRAIVELSGKDIQHESYVWLDGYDYAMKQIIQAIEKELG